MKVTAVIERGKDGTYGIYLADDHNLTFSLIGDGKTVAEAKEDFFVCIQEMREYYEEVGKEFPENLEFEFKYDTASFLQYYSGRFTFAGLQFITGINQGQLSHYVTGRRRPSEKTVRKIEEGIHKFVAELGGMSLI